MKKIEPSINLPKKYRYGFWPTILLIVLAFYSIAQGKSDFNELVSLNANNEPLSEVLENVSQASGYEFIIDENWEDLPITVKFDAIPLDQALKRILANINHAIIYNSDRKVLIRIFEKDSTVSRHTSASTIHRIPTEPAQLIEMPNSPNPVPPEPSTEEAETEKSELSSRQPEMSNEEAEDKNKDDDTSKEEEEASEENRQ